MTYEQIKALNAEMDEDDEAFDELAIEAAHAKLSPEELARIEAEVDADDSDPEDTVDDKLDHKDPRVIAMLERHQASLSPEERAVSDAASDAVLMRLYPERDARGRGPSSTKPPASAPAVAMGLGADGIFRMTDSQARDPAWCARTAAARSKAASIELIQE